MALSDNWPLVNNYSNFNKAKGPPIMKRYMILLIFPAALLLSACGTDDIPLLPLTENLVLQLKAYDLDNNGNASDIRVDFNVQNNLNVSEYRVMILPSASSNAFNEDVAESLPRESVVIIFSESLSM